MAGFRTNLTGGPSSLSGWATRVAVTTIGPRDGFSGDWASTGKAPTKASGSTNERARKIQVFMQGNTDKSHHRRPRQCISVTVARKRATTLLAGIRAGGTTSIAFPSACSERSVAMMEAESRRIRPLTVAGAAQVRFAVDSKPSCFPLNCGV